MRLLRYVRRRDPVEGRIYDFQDKLSARSISARRRGALRLEITVVPNPKNAS